MNTIKSGIDPATESPSGARDDYNADLMEAFSRASPRLAPRSTPKLSQLLQLLVLLATVAIFSRIFFAEGLYTWATGLAYVIYDSVLLLFVTVQTLPLLMQHKDSQPSKTEFTVSHADPTALNSALEVQPSLGVIIAAYNEAAVIERTINALLQQSYPPDQIWVADDGSDDGTAERLLASYLFSNVDTVTNTWSANDIKSLPQALTSASQPSLHWLRVQHGGKARALNQAISQVTTDIVLTVDADTLLAPDAIAEMRHAFAREPELVAATGVLTPICDKQLLGRFFQWFQTYEYIRNFISRFAWMRADSLLLISGAFAGFRRDALVKVGGFDPQCLVEDYELIHRLRRYAAEHAMKWQVRVVGRARARTSAPSNFKDFLQQRRRWFAGFLQTQYWNRDMVANPRFGKVGLLMLPIKTLDTLQPLYGLIAFGLLLVFAIHANISLLGMVLGVIGGKLVIDLMFHLWSIYLYRRWTGDRANSSFLLAIAAALLEPFSFQLLRHVGAMMGWFYFLTGQRVWGKQRRHTI